MPSQSFVKTLRIFLVQAITVLYVFSWIEHRSEATVASCKSLFQQQKYEQAGDCFVREAEKAGKLETLTLPQRWAKGRLLRNAAACYKRMAYQSTPELAAWWREKSLHILQQYLQDKLFENDQRKRDAAEQITALSKEIGYATLQLSISPATANVCVTGYRFRQCQSGATWQLQLRPGMVKISAQALEHAPLDMEITLAPGAKVTRSFQLRSLLAPPPRRHIAASEPVSVEVISVPSGATVSVNGRKVGHTPMSVKLDEAQVTLQIAQPCYITQALIWKHRSLQRRVSVILQRSPQYIQWQNSLGSRQTHVIWGWTVLAAGVAFSGLGIAGYAVATARHDQANIIKKNYENSTNTTDIEKLATTYEQTAQAGNVWRTVGHIGISTGAVALGVGLGRLLTLPSATQPPCQVK